MGSRFVSKKKWTTTGNREQEGDVNLPLRKLEWGPSSYVMVPQRVLEFAMKMGMHVCQVNAQRMFGPSIYAPPGWTPEPGSEIFVGRLPRRFAEPEIVPFLEQVGPIHQLRLLMDFSGTNKGFCFVTYLHPAQAELAVAVLNGLEFRKGFPVVASRSVDNRRLLLAGVPTNRTLAEIWEEVTHISKGVIYINLTWTVPAYQPKGMVIVTYESHRSAALARKTILCKRNSITFWGSRIGVDWAEPEVWVTDLCQYSPQVLHIRNLNLRTRSRNLRVVFNQESFNGVLKIKRFQSQAYIYFKSMTQAEAARVALNGVTIGGNKIQVEWSNPSHVPLLPSEKDQLFRRHLRAPQLPPRGSVGSTLCNP